MEEAFGRDFMMLAWCALYLALLTGEKARAGRATRRRLTAARPRRAELRSLRYQVNPHFLFNTLNSLSALVLTGKTQAAERMIQTISTFYRRSLADDPTADVPLREEFALQKLYLDIEAVRFPHRLRAVYKLPPELEDAKVPGMILQPLVENSVKHAVAPTSEQVTITLAAREEYGRLVLTVSDDGPGRHRARRRAAAPPRAATASVSPTSATGSRRASAARRRSSPGRCPAGIPTQLRCRYCVRISRESERQGLGRAAHDDRRRRAARDRADAGAVRRDRRARGDRHRQRRRGRAAPGRQAQARPDAARHDHARLDGLAVARQLGKRADPPAVIFVHRARGFRGRGVRPRGGRLCAQAGRCRPA
jgi:hypothetical protein